MAAVIVVGAMIGRDRSARDDMPSLDELATESGIACGLELDALPVEASLIGSAPPHEARIRVIRLRTTDAATRLSVQKRLFDACSAAGARIAESATSLAWESPSGSGALIRDGDELLLVQVRG